MQTKFKRHQTVKLLIDPDQEFVEPYLEPPKQIKKGMTGKINVILPNGQYHVEIIELGKTIAYVMVDEDQLELVDASTPDTHQEPPEDWAENTK
ncbi:hypothetical protein COU62_01220 [Candidatus Pacearchaeota archaeon CG10_big_fil_rev_8_21_14_0_10_35_219]|nr:hypothetical protein [Candidatus Pacearchaeota archaeon]OIO43059.1 MAG: hypothetical protein AUJ63_01390 [Candidatus Pacearchaeota archaeon CG1_02_35_32]PIO08185.1 MAG: hypothetical protein COU62_01220 [Candidatus Pacearchaeota archaeon CG10_big_fil_rev_8_21_14_0_10_35_219]PIY81117.1 MAG: hypothetical protein COY79_04930 [Candidatus Pacearchaeota archaeon CG_4_10_14_0_8_um_filter_35_169]PIZ79766.1 MAG: hypothetical protein COY00_03465 [Candidatus Pacearchaeota archaeon CG_4_10_14_0_2_um_filt